MSVSLWIPGPLPGMNELIKAAKGYRGRGIGYANLKRKWTDTVALLARAAKLPRLDRVAISFEWHERTKRHNPDNIAAGGHKVILDGLVKAGVLRNDGWSEIAGFSDTWCVSRKAGVWVVLDSA